MALQIIESCVNCCACEPLCPSQAIVAAKPHFLINASRAPNAWAILPIRNAPAFVPLKAQFSTATVCR
ncbi:hypothetical protein [Chromatium okenii]|uniref:hypothetical protein n=1 Tax=Chromatium okenii TaxID=61644 RepID=UPI003D6AE117